MLEQHTQLLLATTVDGVTGAMGKDVYSWKTHINLHHSCAAVFITEDKDV